MTLPRGLIAACRSAAQASGTASRCGSVLLVPHTTPKGMCGTMRDYSSCTYNSQKMALSPVYTGRFMSPSKDDIAVTQYCVFVWSSRVFGFAVDVPLQFLSTLSMQLRLLCSKKKRRCSAWFQHVFLFVSTTCIVHGQLSKHAVCLPACMSALGALTSHSQQTLKAREVAV